MLQRCEKQQTQHVRIAVHSDTPPMYRATIQSGQIQIQVQVMLPKRWTLSSLDKTLKLSTPKPKRINSH